MRVLLGAVHRVLALGWARRRMPPTAVLGGARELPAVVMLDHPARSWEHRATSDEDGCGLLWPDDPDAVPVWRLERELWADRLGIRLPGYRTRREYEAAVQLLEDAIPDVSTLVSAALPPDDAAREFLGWLRDDDRVGEYTAAELSALYAEHCADTGREPANTDHVKAALATLPGVYREISDTKVSGKRVRAVRWVVDFEAVGHEVHGTTDARPDLRMAA